MPAELVDIMLDGTLEEINVGGTSDSNELITLGELNTAIQNFIQAGDVPTVINLRLTDGTQAAIYLGGTDPGDKVPTTTDVEELIGDNVQTCTEYTLASAIGTTLTLSNITTALNGATPLEFEQFIVSGTDKSFIVVLIGTDYHSTELTVAT